jgi:dsRNA-specific ribonuclease
MKIQVREANTSTPERPLWVWNVFWGNQKIGGGFSPTEKEAEKQAKQAVSQAPRYLCGR